MKMNYKAVRNVLDTLKKGKIALVMDDKERENEGDLICSAEAATTENVNLWPAMQRGLYVCQ